MTARARGERRLADKVNWGSFGSGWVLRFGTLILGVYPRQYQVRSKARVLRAALASHDARQRREEKSDD